MKDDMKTTSWCRSMTSAVLMWEPTPTQIGFELLTEKLASSLIEKKGELGMKSVQKAKETNGSNLRFVLFV